MIRSSNNEGRAAPADEPPLVAIRDVHKSYFLGEVEVPAVRGVSMDIRRREFIAIMGQSGSGKSTLMHILGCLDRCDKGRYSLDGVDVTRLGKRNLAKIRNQKIGFVFQSFNLLSRTTVLDNVAMPLAYAGANRKERRKQASVMLERVGLTDRAHHLSNQLSGGQQQRVAIARALITNPVLLLADEPTGNLDSRTSVEIMALFQELNRQSDLAILIVTHESDISSFAKRTIAFTDGRVAFDEANESIRDAVLALEQLTATTP